MTHNQFKFVSASHRQTAVVSAFLVFGLNVNQVLADDNAELVEIFERDQTARSEENRELSIFPMLQEERDRRIVVMRLLADGELTTADDYLRAAIILHHTSTIVDDSGLKSSLGAENHILAFFLTRRAHELGQKNGAHFMAWTYNYYARACGLDIDTHGYHLVDEKIVAIQPSVSMDESIEKCGFDPTPYFAAINCGEQCAEQSE